ncbi:MAG: cupin domain-containing protein [Thiovulaceae bacterium]|nr:cupin domain-containing protein [Sulfurimonadaceae bacterium]
MTTILFMNKDKHNIFKNLIEPKVGDEIFSTLLEHKNIKIELINSNSVIYGKSYQQEQDEWILLLEGEATLEVEGVAQLLKTGDYLFISAQTVHRVLFTDKKTLWLAIHVF